MKNVLIFLGIVLYLKKSEAAGALWSYHGDTGPSNWVKSFKDCGYNKQSPINIVPNDAVYDESLGAFTLTHFEKSATHTLKNNGHTVQVDVGDTMYVEGGSLGGKFQVAQFHFHWGENMNSGSEHTVNNKMYPLEVHIVTYNTKYNGLGLAVSQPDGLAVLGFFFEESTLENCHYDGLVGLLSDVANAGTNTSVPNTKLLQFIDPFSMKRYFRYQGSLTTPPCYESVTWTVFADTIKISSAQFAEFRKVYQDAGTTIIDKNYRPVQNLNGRVVKASFPTGTSAAQNVFYNSGLVLLSMLFSFYYRH